MIFEIVIAILIAAGLLATWRIWLPAVLALAGFGAVIVFLILLSVFVSGCSV